MSGVAADGAENKAIERLVDLADAKLYELTGMMKPVMESDLLTLDQRQLLSWLSAACTRASGSALILIGFQRLWDAEIVTRSVFEGTVKFCHLLGDPEKATERFDEYEHALSDISSLADHEKARRVIELAPAQNERLAEPIGELLLSEGRRAEISAKYPKEARRRLQSAWGFTGLIEQMVKSGEGLGELAAGLLHGYAMASHVAHADFLGVGMVMEREYRSPERRDAVHRGHAARVISDQLWYCAFRLIVAYRFIDEPRTKILAAMQDGSELWTSLHESQADFYGAEYPNA